MSYGGAGGALAPGVAGAAGGAAAGFLEQGGAGGQRSFLYCIPLALGPPTEHARSMKSWLVRILVLQVICCVLKFVILEDWFGGLWMALVIFVGAHSYWENMNVTYICVWGVACGATGILNVFGAIIPTLLNIVKFDIISTICQILIPLSYFLGAAFAYHLYLDWAQEVNHKPSWFLNFVPDIFMMMKSKAEEKVPFAAGDPYAKAVPPAGGPQQQANPFATQQFNPQQQPYGQQPPQQQSPPGSGGGFEGWIQGVGQQVGSAFGAAAAQSAVQGAQQQAQQAYGFGQQTAQQGAAYGQQAVNQGAAYGHQAVNQGQAYGNQAFQQPGQQQSTAGSKHWWG